MFAISAASPSVRTRSGSNVRRARRAPKEGIVPKGLAITSPLPLNTSAHATAHTSARVGCTAAVTLSPRRRRDAHRECPRSA